MSLPTPTDTPEPEQARTEDGPVDAQPFIDLALKSMALKKYEDAADLFAQAVEALVEQHGELGFECAEPYTLYGKAMLNLAVTKSAVLGGGAPEKKDEPKPEPAAGPVAGPSNGGNVAANHQFHFGGDDPDDDDDEEEEEPEEDSGESVEDLLETAFQMLDIARTIYDKDENAAKEGIHLKLADVHRLLGDVASESEQFESAVDEYSAALSILRAELPPYHRHLSELHMLIALALDFVPSSVERAVEHAEKAKEVLLLKIAHLEELSSPTENDKKEIGQIKELIGDVDLKIEEVRTVAVEAAPTKAEQALADLLQPHIGKLDPSAPVNNLNSLVKKKKPAPQTAPPAEVAVPAGTVEAIAAGEGEGGLKRKAADEEQGEGKKAKLEEAEEVNA